MNALAFGKFCARLVSVVTIFVFFPTAIVSGQHTQTTKDKADNNLKSTARINPSTLAMEFSLPLGNYPGRNGNSTPIALNYSSKIWAMRKVNFRFGSVPVSNNPNYDWTTYQSTDVGAFFSDKSSSGWTSSLQPPVLIVDFEGYDQLGNLMDYSFANYCDGPDGLDWECEFLGMETVYRSECGGWTWVRSYQCCSGSGGDHICQIIEDFECVFPPGGGGSPTPTPTPDITPTPTPAPPSPPEQILHVVDRLRIQMPDGSSKEFRKDDRLYSCAEVPTPSACENPPAGTYLSIDGSAMRLELGATLPSESGAKDVLYLPDGGKYIFPVADSETARTHVAEKYIDANGNITTYNASNRNWTDTLGRSVEDPFEHPLSFQSLTPETQQYVLKGIDNSNITYFLEWKPLDQVFEFPESTSKKYIGEDNCINELPSPITGERLFNNQEVQFGDDEVLNRVNYIRRTRMCGSPYGWGGATLFNPTVLASVVFPNGEKYQFKYNEYGEITRITYPTGGYESFEYEFVAPMGVTAQQIYVQGNRGVTRRHVSEDGISEDQTWSYSVGVQGSGDYGITIMAPDGTKTERLLWSSAGSSFGFEDPRAGMEKEVRVKDVNGNYVSRTFTDWIVTPPEGPDPYAYASRDPRLKRTVSILFENDKALISKAEIEYDTLNAGNSDLDYFARLNPVLQKKYDYVTKTRSEAEAANLSWTDLDQWLQGASLIAATAMEYSYDPGYKARGIPSLATETEVKNPVNLAWPALSKTQTIYDNAVPGQSENYNYSVHNYSTGNSFDCSNDPQAPKVCWQNPNGPTGSIDLSYRGLPTTTRVWFAEENRWIETHTRYNQFGNVVAVRDPIGNETTTVFDTQYKYAYPTSVTAPAPDPNNTGHGTNLTSTIYTSYDFTTGLPLSVTDDFGQVTTTEYDGMLRPIRVNPVVVNGSPTGPKTETVYGLPDPTTGQFPEAQRFVKVRKQLDANNWDESISLFDGLGRTVKTQAKDSQGDVFVETVYDNMGRIDRVTNPYRSGDTVLWSKTRYDSVGRAVETFAPATEAQINANQLQSLGVTSFDISTVNNSSGNFVGTVVITADASGRKSRSITNALGQLIRVDEATATGGTEEGDLGSLAAPNQATVYTYDLHGKMRMVTQGVQKRFFKYDSLGRLIRVSQPEQDFNANLNLSDDYNTTWHWTAGFTYDVLGNVLTATDANGVTITNTYDRAGRVITRTYSGEPNDRPPTPSVEFFYDGKGLSAPQTPNYAKGKLTRVTSSASETQYQLFDNFGQLTQMSQITDGQTYTSSYQYNLSGALVQETYPSGRVVRNEFESDGDLLRVTSQKAAGNVYVPYVSNFSYTASGGISQMRLGNGKWETAKFNNRLQVTELGLGGGPADASLWKVNYEYGELSQDGSSVDAAKNTGNIARQTLTVPGTSFVQSYRYDSLYRLTEAVEKTGTTQNWIQNWSYDRYGNRLTFTQNIAGNTNATNPTVDPNTNRFTSTDFGYDQNGNVVRDIDPLTSLSRTFVFNGDNKQTEVKDANGGTIGRYFYDGEGKRVKKIVGDETTVFVYSAGKLVAEYSTELPTDPSVNYTTTDHLGSPRIITDELGQVKSRRDFLPFGEEIAASVGNRSIVGLQYTSGDSVRQKFTGYQKDDETSLDFAEARMYENQYGRFTAVDPLLASGKSANPQTFNRYTYTSDNPIIRVDRDGKIWGTYDHHVRWFKNKAAMAKAGYSEFRPVNWVYQSKEDGRMVKLSPNSPRWQYIADYVPGERKAANTQTGYVNRDFIRSVAVNSSSEVTGIGKGIVNFFPTALNGLTWTTLNFGIGGAYFQGRNPLAVPMIFTGRDARETSSMSAGTTGIGLGLGFSAGVFTSGSTLSVVPRFGEVTNPVPSTLARVIPGEGPFPTLGPPGRSDVFVTAADDIAGMNASQIGPRLGIPDSNVFTVIEFPTPSSGVASPVFRPDPGFVGFGRTSGGAREFVIPNGPIPCSATIRLVCQ